MSDKRSAFGADRALILRKGSQRKRDRVPGSKLYKDERFFNPGFNASITKPVELEKLFGTLFEVISGQEHLAGGKIKHQDGDS